MGATRSFVTGQLSGDNTSPTEGTSVSAKKISFDLRRGYVYIYIYIYTWYRNIYIFVFVGCYTHSSNSVWICCSRLDHHTGHYLKQMRLYLIDDCQYRFTFVTALNMPRSREISRYFSGSHIEAETKWPPFSRRHFQMDFLE